MACKNINRRATLKIIALGLFLAGMFLLAYSHSIYVEEKLTDQRMSCDESFKVNMIDALAGCCILVSLVLNLAGSFVRCKPVPAIPRK